MRTIKILIAILLNFLNVIAIMKLLTSLNVGNLFLNILAIIGLVLLLSLLVNTQFYTKFPKIKKPW